MDHLFKHFLIAGAAVTLALGADSGARPRFYPDDPIAKLPDLADVKNPRKRDVDAMVDFIVQSVQPNRRPPTPPVAINTLGEVPDSSWYTNRHAKARMSLEELREGPGNANAPVAPFQVIAGKTEGITPGFTMRDARGRMYFVKPDPESNPEMATAADVIGSKFFHALGYNTPENYIVYAKAGDLALGPDAKVKGVNGKERPMLARDFSMILEKMPLDREGRMRFVASLALPGKPIGPFRYSGTRSDDPNDVFPHERRRDLRGLHVLAAWLNHTDSKSGNSLDVLVKEHGRQVIRHYLIDFGAILGSDSDMAKNARYGHEFVLPTGSQALRKMFTFGIPAEHWETIEYRGPKQVGRFTATGFDPELWKSNYPNPAFLSRQPEDEYWAAKLVMAFTDEEIRAIVETGEYSNPEAVEFIATVLSQRRDVIGRTYFNKVLALDGFRVEGERLRFDDLLVRYGFAVSRVFRYVWNRFDNQRNFSTAIPFATSSAVLPGTVRGAADGSYFMVRIEAAGDTSKAVQVYLRKRAARIEVVGIERIQEAGGSETESSTRLADTLPPPR